MRTRNALALGCVALAGCAWVADIEQFNQSLLRSDAGAAIDASKPPEFLPAEDGSLFRTETLDAGDAGDGRGASYPPDAGKATDECATFLCGSFCVSANDPTYGCSPANACQPCPTGVHGKASCVAGECSFQCNTGYGNCDGYLTDGCEVDLANNTQRCGSCANNCAALASAGAHAIFSCSAGSCVANCKTGYADCDKQASNGCECELSAHYCANNNCQLCKGSGVQCTTNGECCGAAMNTAQCQFDPGSGVSYCTSTI